MGENLVRHFETFSSYVPIDLREPQGFLLATTVVFFFVLFRYFLIAGLFWFVFYRKPSTPSSFRQIYARLPGASAQWTEIRWSILTSLIFAFAGALLGLFWQLGWARIYLPFDEFGYWYLPLSLGLLAILHETYFYLTHRWMHRPRIFRWIHRVHHQSLTPSPWASFSFHPGEAVVQAAAIPLFLLFLPIHPVMLILYLTLMTISAVLNHLGFELLPRGRLGIFLGTHFVSGLHHAGHHRSFRHNYALFFPLWDRLFRTEDPSFSTELAQRLGPGGAA